MSNSSQVDADEEFLDDLFEYPPDTNSKSKKFDNGDLFKNNSSRVQQQRHAGQFCDVTLLAGYDGTKIVAHRNILASASDYFATMFSTKMKEETAKEITIEGVNGDVLEAIVYYCYTGSIVITLDNVQGVYETAHLMDLCEIVETCSQFLIEVLHPSNCLRIKLFAERMSDSDLLEPAKFYLEEHFAEVCEQQEFKHLCFDQLIALLERDHLQVEHEEHRFNAVKNWVDHNHSNRRIHIPALLSLIELKLFKPEFLVNTVEGFLPDEPVYKKMVIDLLKSHLPPKPNKLAPLESVLVVGANVSDPGNTFIECYHPESNSWSRYLKMYDGREDFEVAVLNENLYMIGGIIGGSTLDEMLCLNLKNGDGVWSSSASMYSNRRCFGVAILNGFIYVIGGRGNSNDVFNSVERWTPSTSAWQTIAPMQHKRVGHRVAVFGGMLYAVGGDVPIAPIETIERYNPGTNEWTQCKSLESGRKSVDVVANGEHLYVLTKAEDSSYLIETYQPETDSWLARIRLTHASYSVRACLFGERIGIIRCYTDRPNTVEVYYPKSKKLTYLTSLRFPKKNIRAVMVPAIFT